MNMHNVPEENLIISDWPVEYMEQSIWTFFFLCIRDKSLKKITKFRFLMLHMFYVLFFYVCVYPPLCNQVS